MTVTFDSVNLTALSESHARVATVDTFQVHHAATTSFGGARALMDPGGRQVSSNGLLGSNGHLQHVVDYHRRRAFTSGVPAQDQRAFTVETVNATAGPDWVISAAAHERLARMLYELNAEFGVPIRRGQPGMLGHREVPGTYATACPGPSMNLDWIVARAQQMKEQTNRKKDSMTTNYSVTLTNTAEAGQLDPLIKAAMVAQKVPALATFPVVLTAMCGDSPGTIANALFVNGNTGKSIADHFIAQHGAALPCNLPTFNGIVAPYLTPITQPISGDITATSAPDPETAAELVKQTGLLGSIDGTLKQPVGPIPA